MSVLEQLPVPRQLPRDDPHFTGRQTDLAGLNDLLNQNVATGAATVHIVAVVGTAGVGKTALAVRWAYSVRDLYPDGILFADLRGYDRTPPVSPGQVIDGFLRTLGAAPEAIPADLGARTGMFRSILHGRRVLVVLDNARSPEQVRPLLPNSRGCAVIVTSRNDMPGLVARDGASRMALDLLDQAEAAGLLRRILGDRRAATDPEAIAALASRCAYLPLALRVAAELASRRQHATLREIAADLEATRDRLDRLTVEGDDHTALRSVFSWSYAALPAEAARVFRLLGLHAGPNFTTNAAAALAGTSSADSARVLQVLTHAHLLEEPTAGRYRFHDLLREYAADCCDQADAQPERAAAACRCQRWYMTMAQAASAVLDRLRLGVPQIAAVDGVISPDAAQFATHAEALAWYAAELTNLVAAVRQAHASGEDDTATELVKVMRSYFQLSMPLDEWNTMSELGLAAARRAGSRLAEASMLSSLAGAANYANRLGEALEHAEQAFAIRRDLVQVRAIDLVNLGSAYSAVARNTEATKYLKQAIVLARRTGDHVSEGHALELRASISIGRSHFKAATRLAQQAIEVFRRAELPYGESIGLARLADACLELGRFEEAVEYGRQNLAITEEIGYISGQGWARDTIARALHRTGQIEAARQEWRRAFNIYTAIGDNDAATTIRERLSGVGDDVADLADRHPSPVTALRGTPLDDVEPRPPEAVPPAGQVKPAPWCDYSGETKLLVCQRLGDNWTDLADYLKIALHEREHIQSGQGPREVWHWLQRRDRLAELAPALRAIDRTDLADLLDQDDRDNA